MITAAELLLKTQKALLFNMTPFVRYVFVEVIDRKLIMWVYVDREPTEDERDDFYSATGEIDGDFTELNGSEVSFFVGHEKYDDIAHLKHLVYARTDRTDTAEYWIEKLGLESHVEGGSFKEIYRSELVLSQLALTTHHNGDRNAMTSIYFLLKHGDFSAFHRIASDEIWHFYDGSPLCVYEITTSGKLVKHILGKDIENGQQLVVIIKAGSWFGSRCEEPGGFTLCGCTVAPGFDFADFELADRGALQKEFPQHAGIIEEMTRK